MNKLLNKKKITIATFKAFIRRNSDKLYIKVNSKFNGMIDMVDNVEDDYSKVDASKINLNTHYTAKDGWKNFNNELGIPGCWLVGGGRDYTRLINNDKYVGINIFNSCGSFNIVVKKTKER